MARTVISEVPHYLCCQCGICEAVCTHQRIRLVSDGAGSHWPTGPEECNDCKGLCVTVCPGRAINTYKVEESEDIVPYSELIGHYQKICVVKASDKEIQYHSSSGGAITALLQHLLNTGQIDGAIVTKLDKQNPFEPITFIAKSAEEVFEARGSKYLPVPACRAIKDILRDKDKKDKRYAFVGLPCHICGVLKAKQRIPRLKKQIPFTFAIFCGRNATLQLTRYALKQHGIKLENVKSIEFRSKGWPGKMTVVTEDGLSQSFNNTSWKIPWANNFYNLNRCVTCPDFIGEHADLCFGDPWLPEFIEDGCGLSTVIAKTRIAAKMLEQSEEANIVKIVTELPIDRLILSQIGQFKKKKLGVKIVYMLEKLRGRKVPQYNGKLPKQTKEALLYAFLLYANHNISKLPFFTPIFNRIPMRFWDVISSPFKKNVVKL
jgi:coenzyme F420 hydrogenase subunit beta